MDIGYVNSNIIPHYFHIYNYYMLPRQNYYQESIKSDKKSIFTILLDYKFLHYFPLSFINENLSIIENIHSYNTPSAISPSSGN